MIVADVVRDELKRAFAEHLPAQRAVAADDGYVTIARAAEVAAVNPATIRSWIRVGALPSFKAGRVHRLRLSDVHAYLARKPEHADVDIREEARRMLARSRRWERAKNAARAEATARGEKLTHHQLRSRTHTKFRKDDP